MTSTTTSTKVDGGQPPAKRFKPTYSGTITILAGIRETLFEVHKDIICRHSDFFVASCSEAWAEGKEGTVKLPTVESATVKLYIHWAYTGNINLDVLDGPGLASNYGQTAQLLRLYIAADMFLNRIMKNKTMDAILQRMSMRTFAIDWHSANLVWDNTTGDSPLRSAILHWSAATTTRDGFSKAVLSLRPAFVIDLAGMLLDLKGEAAFAMYPTYERRSQYHDYGVDNAKCSEKCSTQTA
ncbi:hypothetical protein LTR74_017250 [Friedmanniomyces endolithicus]|nr:hypothetical protein LTR74_017250 [Friedmanniomyces endolithicus]